MSVEIIYPIATGLIILVASTFGIRIYQHSGNRAVAWLAVGLIFVAIQSFMEGFINWRIDVKAAFYGSKEHYILDAIRGIFIILWATAQLLMILELAGIEDKWVYWGVPALITAAGTVFTIDINILSKIPEPSHLLLVSSIGRVLGILIPTSLLLGFYMLVNIARPTGSLGALTISLAFLLHAFTLPTYSIAKGMGPATLGLWYAIGGVIPAFMATLGFHWMAKERPT